MFQPATRNSQTTVAIVGGTQGLGLAIAKQLIAEGCAKLSISGRDKAKGEAAADALKELGADAVFISMDLTDSQSCIDFVNGTVEKFGSVNGLVNAAANTERGGLLDTSPEFFDEVFAMNAKAPFFSMQAFAQHCIDEKHPGSIVNILSIARHCGQSFLAPYSASKQALGTLTKNAAAAMMQHRIRVNGVAPGWMDTPGEDAIQKRVHNAPDNWLEMAEAEQPFGQLIKPEEVAGLVAYLISPQAGVMTGSIIDQDQNVIGAWGE